MKNKAKIIGIIFLWISIIILVIVLLASLFSKQSIIEDKEVTISSNETISDNTIETIDNSVSNNSIISENKEELMQTVENPWNGIDISIYMEKKHDNVTPISVDDLYKKMENKETFILLIEKNQCKWCTVVYPVLGEEATILDVPIYCINTSYFSENYPEEENEIYKEMKKQHAKFKNTFMYRGVPSLRYIENGELAYGISNPLPGSYYADDATKVEKKKAKEECLEKINNFIALVNKGKGNISIEDKDTWEEFKYDLIESWKEEETSISGNEIIDDTKNLDTMLQDSEITKDELWELEKQYNKRLAPKGESYWDSVEEEPTNEITTNEEIE